MKPEDATPSEHLLYLLGGMNAKIDNISHEQTLARTEASEFRSEVRTEVSGVKTELGAVKNRVVALETNQPVKLRWPALAGGIASIVAFTTGVVLLIQWVSSNPF